MVRKYLPKENDRPDLVELWKASLKAARAIRGYDETHLPSFGMDVCAFGRRLDSLMPFLITCSAVKSSLE